MLIRLTGGQSIDASPDIVWHALHDVDRLEGCLPNCLSLRRLSPIRYAVALMVPFGPASVSFEGMVEVSGSLAPERLNLRARGEGGLAGRAKGRADITLRATRHGCRLIYAVEAEPSGPLVVLGTLLLSRVGRQLADRFVADFGATVARAARNEMLCSRETATSA